MSQPPLDFDKVREWLDAFEFGRLFIEELGWSNPPAGRAAILVSELTRTIAQLHFEH